MIPHLHVRSLRLLLLAILALGAASCAQTAERVEDQVVTQWGPDLLVVGGQPRVMQDVRGDVVVAGGDVYFSGNIDGDYIGAGGRQLVEGSVQGSARAAGGEVELRSEVVRNATLAGGRIHLAQGSRVEENAYLAGGVVLVDGDVGLHLRAVGEEIILNGEIDGSAIVDGRRLRVGPGAQIAGNLRYRVPEGDVSIDPAAQIEGDIIQLDPQAQNWIRWSGWLLRGLWILGFLLVGIVLVLLLPGGTSASSEGLRQRPLVSAGLGILWIALVPLVIGLAAATVIGLPLAFILMGVFAISLYVARVITALWLGRLLLGWRGREHALEAHRERERQRVERERAAEATIGREPEPAAYDEEPAARANERGTYAERPDSYGGEPRTRAEERRARAEEGRPDDWEIGVQRPGRGFLLGAFLVGGLLLVILEVLPLIGFLALFLATLFGLGALLLGFRRGWIETRPEGSRA